jgi:CBS-domain-containing membrane protein
MSHMWRGVRAWAEAALCCCRRCVFGSVVLWLRKREGGAGESCCRVVLNLLREVAVTALLGPILCVCVSVTSVGVRHFWLCEHSATRVRTHLPLTFAPFAAITRPSGGATALIAIISGGFVVELGYLYVLVPVLSGALVMLLVALLINNLDPYRSYPLYWY